MSSAIFCLLPNVTYTSCVRIISSEILSSSHFNCWRVHGPVVKMGRFLPSNPVSWIKQLCVTRLPEHQQVLRAMLNDSVTATQSLRHDCLTCPNI